MFIRRDFRSDNKRVVAKGDIVLTVQLVISTNKIEFNFNFMAINYEFILLNTTIKLTPESVRHIINI